jgi:hypothetical protein
MILFILVLLFCRFIAHVVIYIILMVCLWIGWNLYALLWYLPQLDGGVYNSKCSKFNALCSVSSWIACTVIGLHFLLSCRTCKDSHASKKLLCYNFDALHNLPWHEEKKLTGYFLRYDLHCINYKYIL